MSGEYKTNGLRQLLRNRDCSRNGRIHLPLRKRGRRRSGRSWSALLRWPFRARVPQNIELPSLVHTLREKTYRSLRPSWCRQIGFSAHLARKKHGLPPPSGLAFSLLKLRSRNLPCCVCTGLGHAPIDRRSTFAKTKQVTRGFAHGIQTILECASFMF